MLRRLECKHGFGVSLVYPLTALFPKLGYITQIGYWGLLILAMVSFFLSVL